MRPLQHLSAFFIFSEILDTQEGQWYEKMSYLGHIAFKTITNCDMAFRISVIKVLTKLSLTLQGIAELKSLASKVQTTKSFFGSWPP